MRGMCVGTMGLFAFFGRNKRERENEIIIIMMMVESVLRHCVRTCCCFDMCVCVCWYGLIDG